MDLLGSAWIFLDLLGSACILGLSPVALDINVFDNAQAVSGIRGISLLTDGNLGRGDPNRGLELKLGSAKSLNRLQLRNDFGT